MIEMLEQSKGDVLGIRATGRLTGADYRDVLEPRLELLLKHFRRLRVLFLMDSGCTGWSVGAAWANTVLDIKHRRDFEKIAIVGAPTWEEWCVRIFAAPLIRSQLRTFRLDELAGAWDWLQS